MKLSIEINNKNDSVISVIEKKLYNKLNLLIIVIKIEIGSNGIIILRILIMICLKIAPN